MKCGFVYILANERPTLYVGVTNNLKRRVLEHKSGIGSDFTKRYKINKLVYYEYFERIESAIVREKQLKDLNRVDKVDLINKTNDSFSDLYSDIAS